MFSPRRPATRQKIFIFSKKNSLPGLTTISGWILCRPCLKRDSGSRETKELVLRLFWDCKLELNFVPVYDAQALLGAGGDE